MLAAVAAVFVGGGAAAAPADLINSIEHTKTAPGNSAVLTVTAGNSNYTLPMMVIVTLYATAKYTPPNPTWFVTAINVAGTGLVAKNETYADGNLGSITMVNNTVTQTHILAARSTAQITVSAAARGNGASSITNTTLRVKVRTIGVSH